MPFKPDESRMGQVDALGLSGEGANFFPDADPLGINKPKQAPKKAQVPKEEPQEETQEKPKPNQVREAQGFRGWLDDFVAGGLECCSMRNKAVTDAGTRPALPQPGASLAASKSMDRQTDTPAAPSAVSVSKKAAESKPLLPGSAASLPPSSTPPQRAVEPVSRPAASAAPSASAYLEPGLGDGEILWSPPPPTGKMRGHWKWPAFCLDFKNSKIQVYVADDTAPNKKGGWVNADPKERGVDHRGWDMYLSCEYKWNDGEVYCEDFTPETVRQRGHKASLLELYGIVNGIHDKGAECGVDDHQ